MFEDLGIYRLLSEIADIGSVEAFIHRWLGALLDYDAAKGAQLVETLSCYLGCGGHYDLTDPDTRFNLQLATQAWKTGHAMRQGP